MDHGIQIKSFSELEKYAMVCKLGAKIRLWCYEKEFLSSVPNDCEIVHESSYPNYTERMGEISGLLRFRITNADKTWRLCGRKRYVGKNKRIELTFYFRKISISNFREMIDEYV